MLLPGIMLFIILFEKKLKGKQKSKQLKNQGIAELYNMYLQRH